MTRVWRQLFACLLLSAALGLVACSDGGSSPTDPPAPVAQGPTQASPSGGAGDALVGQAAISLEKSTNGFDADEPTGPEILVGDPVAWEYVVTNTGDEAVAEIVVTDDQGVTVTCPNDRLGAGESMTCTAGGTAVLGQYSNLGSVTGVSDPGGEAVAAEDPSHYLGVEEAPAEPAIDLEKSTNGFDADEAPGPEIIVGEAVEWTYVVTNTGDVGLGNIEVTDDILGSICEVESLEPGESATCTATGVAEAGQYANVGTATGEDAEMTIVSDDDPSHYLGVAALDCEAAVPSVDLLWPANHRFAPISILGVVDALGNPIAITIDSIFQDEPVNDVGDGNTEPDGMGVGTDTAEVRAERAGVGNGRVYHIGFTASSGEEEACSGEVLVGVPHDRASAPIDDGALYDSTVP